LSLHERLGLEFLFLFLALHQRLGLELLFLFLALKERLGLELFFLFLSLKERLGLELFLLFLALEERLRLKLFLLFLSLEERLGLELLLFLSLHERGDRRRERLGLKLAFRASSPLCGRGPGLSIQAARRGRSGGAEGLLCDAIGFLLVMVAHRTDSEPSLDRARTLRRPGEQRRHRAVPVGALQLLNVTQARRPRVGDDTLEPRPVSLLCLVLALQVRR
jgi:hypothetical protein